VRVGILQTRHAEVLADLVRRRGGDVLVAPILREEEVEDLRPLREALDRLAGEAIDVAVFQTGVGAVRLFNFATDMGCEQVLLHRLASSSVLARGPKPLAALHQHKVRVDLRTREPHTTAEVVELLDVDLRNRTVFVQHHGAPNAVLTDTLRERGARLLEAVTYQWALPEDLGPVKRFLDELTAGAIDVTVFTSMAQVINLFAIAEHLGRADEMKQALAEKTRIASIGPTTSASLGEHGLRVAIQPEHTKMVPLVGALCAHYGAR
jgi:uroporphyrinogen-III synthase